MKGWKHKGLLCIQCGGKEVKVKHLFCRTENKTVTTDSRKWLALLQVSYLHVMAKLKWSEKIWVQEGELSYGGSIRKSSAARSIPLAVKSWANNSSGIKCLNSLSTLLLNVRWCHDLSFSIIQINRLKLLKHRWTTRNCK